VGRRWHLIVDVDRCEDCNNCLLACKDEHVDNEWPGYAAPQPRHGHRWIDILRRERGAYPLIDVVYLPLTCMHCDRPPCVEAGKGAVSKREDGIVLIDPVVARGREDLVDSCPYGMIWWNDDSDLPQKCTLCAHLLDAGWTQPRCVQACPTGALSMSRCDDAEFRTLMHREGLEYLQRELGTVPTVLYRNLSRYLSFRLSGSVTIEHDGMVDCAKGARVELRRGDAAGATPDSGAATTTDTVAPIATTEAVAPVVAATETDAFGDFVFDGLDPRPADYSVAVLLPGYVSARVAARVDDSLTMEAINLTRVAGDLYAAGDPGAIGRPSVAGEPSAD
jgi:Fe-S-cluster-containing dehydrogenase component